MAGYKVLVDGKESSSGVNFFSLLQTAGGWKIAGIADTQWAGASIPPLVISKPAPGVTAVLEAFFDGLKCKDWTGMLDYLLPGGGITNSRPTGIIQGRWPYLIEMLQEVTLEWPPSSVVEELIFLEVRVVGDVALV